MTQPTGRFSRWGPLIIIGLPAVIMLCWSWGTWPDPLVDFGAQLYVPWQLSTGHVLYRDVAYYSGPFSSYFNAAAFCIFGVGLRTLVWLNLLIVAATITVAYRLTTRVSGSKAATLSGLIFVIVFAFGQTVGVGNYNWLTPYTHEVCHGTAMGIAAIAMLRRFQNRGRSRWLIPKGLMIGCVLLTKAEPTAAALFGIMALLIGDWWINRTPWKRMACITGILVGCALVPPAIAAVLLSRAMPLHQAIYSMLGSWPWAFDPRMSSLHFYRQVAGLDDVAGNLHVMLDWSVVYAILIGAGIAGGLVSRSRQAGRTVGTVLFLLIGTVIIWRFNSINWSGMLTPLPIVLGVVLLFAIANVLFRKDQESPLRLALVVFAAVLVAKMGLTTRAYHYGFVLAWPATTVMLCVMAVHLPDWIDRHGGRGNVLRAVGLVALIAGVWVLLTRDAQNFTSKKMIIAQGTADEFRGNSAALEVKQVCNRVTQLVPTDGTVEVLPQGLMINYLTRHTSPTRYTNFMPPEVLAAGEQTILSALRNHPPDLIVLTTSSIQNGSFTLDGQDPYGASTLAWVGQNYQMIEAPPLRSVYGFMIMEKRKP